MPYPYFGYGYPGLDLGSVAQPVLGQMPPSFGVDPETQRAAVNQMLIAMGANILGAPIGDYTGALGAGFAGGQQAYQGEIARARELQQQDFRNRMAMEELALSQAAGQRAEQGLIMEGQAQKAAFKEAEADRRMDEGQAELDKAGKVDYLGRMGHPIVAQSGRGAMLLPDAEIDAAYAEMQGIEALQRALQEDIASEEEMKRRGLGRYYESPNAPPAPKTATMRDVEAAVKADLDAVMQKDDKGKTWLLPNGKRTDNYYAAKQILTAQKMIEFGLAEAPPEEGAVLPDSPADRALRGQGASPQPAPPRGAGGGFTHPGAFLAKTAINQQREVSRDFELDTEVRGKIDALRAEMSPEQQAALDSYIQQVVAQFGYVMSPEARTLIFRKANQLLMGR